MQNKTEIEKELVIRELAKRKFEFFVPYVFRNYVSEDFNKIFFEYLQAVKEGQIKKLLVELPPRSMKSEAIAKLFPAWVLGNSPNKEIVCASYSADLANKHARECKQYTQEQYFKNVFPKFSLADDKREAGNWETKEKGGYYSTGVGGTLTGRGFDIGIIDDPIKNREEAESNTVREKIFDWYTSTFLTRRKGGNSSIILLMTRWHDDDLAGRLLNQERSDWTELKLPAIDDNGNALVKNRSGYGIEFYEQVRKEIGTRDFEALYQQDPIKGSGNIFKKEDIRYFALSDINPNDFTVAISVDPAFSSRGDSDDTAIVVSAKHKITKEIYILEAFGAPLLPSQSFSYIVSLAQKWKSMGYNLDFISIEKVDLSKAQDDFISGFQRHLQENGLFYTVLFFKPQGQGKKEDRIKFTLEPMFNRGAIYFRCDDSHNEVWRKIEEQLLKFPLARHDDLIDTISQSVKMWTDRNQDNFNYEAEINKLIGKTDSGLGVKSTEYQQYKADYLNELYNLID